MAVDKTRCNQASATINSSAIKVSSNRLDSVSSPNILDVFSSNDNKSVFN
jgi:hypothetical protein